MIPLLPFDIYPVIFSFSSPQTLCRASRVCKKWERHLKRNPIWERHSLKDFAMASSSRAFYSGCKNHRIIKKHITKKYSVNMKKSILLFPYKLKVGQEKISIVNILNNQKQKFNLPSNFVKDRENGLNIELSQNFKTFIVCNGITCLTINLVTRNLLHHNINYSICAEPFLIETNPYKISSFELTSNKKLLEDFKKINWMHSSFCGTKGRIFHIIDKKLHIYNVKHKRTKILETDCDSVSCTEDFILLSRKKILKEILTIKGKIRQIGFYPYSELRKCKGLPKNHIFVRADGSHNLEVWDLEKQACVRSFNTHLLDFSLEIAGDRIILYDEWMLGLKLVILEYSTGNKIACLELPDYATRVDIKFQILTLNLNNSLIFIDLTDGRVLKTIKRMAHVISYQNIYAAILGNEDGTKIKVIS